MRKLRFAIGALAGVGATATYAWVLRPWMHRWGATDEEVRGPWAGDEQVRDPNYFATLGLTIRAQPEDVWPWLAQLGNGRGGLYSYDWLDRLFGYLEHDSANEILAQYQEIRPGDVVPIGGTPGEGFRVAEVERNRHLVLAGTSAGGVQYSWAFLLVPRDGETRLLSRNRVRLPEGPRTWALLAWLDPAAFLMTRKMMLGIRERAEHLAEERERGAGPRPVLVH